MALAGAAPPFPSLAVEVPISTNGHGVGATTIQVEGGDGRPLFTFPRRTAAGSTLRTDRQVALTAHTPYNAASTLIWKLDAEEPAVLTLQLYSFATDLRDAEAWLHFAAPLLPHVSTFETVHAVHLAALAADGTLHTLKLDLQPQPQSQALHRQLAAADALHAVPLAPTFARLGAPTCLLHVSDYICIGTDQGHVVCLPALRPDPDAAVELKAGGGGLSSVLGGLWGRAAPRPVQALAELQFLNGRLLCCISQGATFGLWDVEGRRMLHSSTLLAPDEAARHRATIIRISEEPLDASTSMMVVYFEPSDPSSTAPGLLCTFSVFLEDRSGAYKVEVQAGPRLGGEVHRLVDVAVQHVGSDCTAAWLLYDDEAGRRALHCVPVTLADGAVEGATEACLMEDQLARCCGQDPGQEFQVEDEVWRAMHEAAEADVPGAAGAGAMADAFLDLLMAPGSLSRPALHAALTELGCSLPVEDVTHAELVQLRAAVPGWLAAACNDDLGLRQWCSLLRVYSAAFHRAHPPLALLQQITRQDEVAMVLVRGGGTLSSVGSAEPVELALRGVLHAAWAEPRSPSPAAAKALLRAARRVTEALGGPLTLRLMWGCMRHGAGVQTLLAPAAMRALAAGLPAAGTLSDAGRLARGEWRARCRRLPLALGELLTSAPGELSAALNHMLTRLSHHRRSVLGPKRSPMGAPTRQVTAAAMCTAAQVAGAQVECLLQLTLLAEYLSHVQCLGTWALHSRDAQALQSEVLPGAAAMLTCAGVAYWAAVTPIATGPGDGDVGGAADMVVALHLGADAGEAGPSAPKRARLSSVRDRFAGELLLASAPAMDVLHAVRDALDLLSVGSTFARWLLQSNPAPEPGFDPATMDDEDAAMAPEATVTARALALAPELFRGRHSAALAGLLRLLGEPDDARLQFFAACSRVGRLRDAPSEAERQQLETEAVSLFFAVAAIFAHREFFAPQLAAVRAAVSQLHADATQAALPDEGRAAEELQYHEALMALFERAGRPAAASRFALAAAKLVAPALPGEGAAAARLQREGRLWANVFAFCLENGEYEAAYAALLGNQVAELQIDCVHRLVNELSARGQVELLCRLPFAHTMLVVRRGRPAWVPLLQEASAALARRAANLDLDARPQPYHVLYDFHATRGNFQAAAAAQLAYARRLAAERPGEGTAAVAAQRALGAALSALSLVEAEQAWLEDPGPRLPPTASGAFAVAGNEDSQEEEHLPLVLTLEDLRREYATARAHAAVAAAMPGGDATSSAPEDIFQQLLALGLHDEAFALADAVYLGTKLDRAREQAVASLAAACVALQAHSGRASAALLPAADGDLMEDDGVADSGDDAAANDAAVPLALSSQDAAALTADAAWRRLRGHLERYEAERRNGYSLRVVAVDAALSVERRLVPPPWLVAPFIAPPPSPGADAAQPRADVAGLLRALMRHGRLEDAAELAGKTLGAITQSVPSVALARTAAVCVPHALLQELAARLAAQGGAGAAAGRRVEELLGAERAAAGRQTRVLEEIYA